MSTDANAILSRLLTAGSHRAGERISEYRDLLKVLQTIHIFRSEGDPRCRVCREPSGKPSPFPCVTDLLTQAATGGHPMSIDAIVLLRNAGRALNGEPALPDSGLRHDLGPLLHLLHDAHGFSWADPERLPR